MVAETATDLADLFSGSDLAASITLANGCVVAGRFAYGFAESLDYNGRVPTIEQGERTKLLFLGKP